MPRVKLTKSAIDDLPTSAKEVVYWDAACPGLRKGHTNRTQGFCRAVQDGRRRFAAAKVHHWPLRSRHSSSGAGVGAKGLRGEA
jgi:hypothetical protein